MTFFRHPSPVAMISGLGLLLGFAALAGCSPKEENAPAPPAGGDLAAQGKAVFAANNCANCHAIDGAGGRTAPDLSKVGGEAEHTAEWLVAHIKNPKAHNPNSRMPAFEGKISDTDLLALGAYLASLK